ncbi:MAG: carbohydrate-binding domain-containing protein [Clostridiales bacterium]|nr:carbohydrate-binding domain-containing protein [Clostridiales bacterium]
MKRIFTAFLPVLVFALLASCDADGAGGTVSLPDELIAEYFSDFDLRSGSDISGAVTVTLADGASAASGEGVDINGDVITVTAAGTYVFSGTLTDGQIAVRTDETGKVVIVLNGVSVSNSTTAPFYLISADKALIYLAEGSENVFTDSDSYAFPEGRDKPNACIYGADDLTISGSGSLSVTGNYNNGIGCANDLRIVSGTIAVTAVNNALKGNDSVAVAGGAISLTASGDGIKSDEEIDTSKGYVAVVGGSITINAVDDGIQAVKSITVAAGSVKITAGDKAVNCDGSVSIADGCLK